MTAQRPTRVFIVDDERNIRKTLSLHILRVLSRTKTQEEAARILGLDVSTLWRKRRKYEEE